MSAVKKQHEFLDLKKCIICQETTEKTATSSNVERKRISESADIRQDIVAKRLKEDGEQDFVHHVTNQCYTPVTKVSGQLKQNGVEFDR